MTNAKAISFPNIILLIYQSYHSAFLALFKGTFYMFLCTLIHLYSSTSSASVQLCVWSTDGWEKQRARSLQLLGRSTSQSDTRVQFHQDQTHFLVVHEAQIAIYETTKLECVKQVSPLCDCSWLFKRRLISTLIHNIFFYSGFHVKVLPLFLMRHSRVIASWYMPVSWMQLFAYSLLRPSICDAVLFLQLIYHQVLGIFFLPR